MATVAAAKYGTVKKVSQSILGVSEPPPSHFGNDANELDSSTCAKSSKSNLDLIVVVVADLFCPTSTPFNGLLTLLLEEVVLIFVIYNGVNRARRS